MAKNDITSSDTALSKKDMKIWKPLPPRPLGRVGLKSDTKLISGLGTAGLHFLLYMLENMRGAGINLIPCLYTAFVSEDADWRLITEEFNRSRKGFFDLSNIKQALIGNTDGGYKLPPEKDSIIARLGHNGFEKDLSVFTDALCRDPDLITKFEKWRILACKEVSPKISVLINLMAKGGATASNVEFLMNSALSRSPPSEISHTMCVNHLEYANVSPNSSEIENQIFNMLVHLATDSAFYDVWVMTDDGCHSTKSGGFSDPTELNRETSDKLVMRALNGLLCGKSISAEGARNYDIGDIFHNFEAHSKSKVLAVFGTEFEVTKLKRGKIYSALNRFFPSVDAERIDLRAVEDLATEVFLAFKNNLWDFALTTLDWDFEKKYYRSQTGDFVIGGGLNKEDYTIIDTAWKRAGMNSTAWNKHVALYPSDYLTFALFYIPRGKLVALEEIFDVSYPSREVSSFASLIAKKDRDKYYCEATEHYQQVANLLHIPSWKKPYIFRPEAKQWRNVAIAPISTTG